MKNTQGVVLVLVIAMNGPTPVCAQKPARAVEAIELIGSATEFHFTRNWNSYYWREDFTFLLKDDRTGKSWRVLSREPTPAYDSRMGTTFTEFKPDWKKEPRVRVIGVSGVDRLPANFYEFKLDETFIATAHLVFVEVTASATPPLVPGMNGSSRWKLYHANNWFHKWSEQADPIIHGHFADKEAPFDIYGFINGQAAPFNRRSMELIERHPGARMFHGVVRTAKYEKFGYELDVLHLIGPDKGGNGVVFHGDPKTLPLLDKKR